MECTLIVETHFDAAHLLPYYEGDCAQLHGHTYRVIVEVTGFVEHSTGMVMDLRDLKTLVADSVYILDHSSLNSVKGLENPTAENICNHILQRLGSRVPSQISEVSVTVYEGKGAGAKMACQLH